MSTYVNQAPCIICGGRDFKPAPFGRLTLDGSPPVCTGCGGLERHRVIRAVWNAIGTQQLRNQRTLQFSSDPAIDANWFEYIEVSIYGARNSMDLENLPGPDNEYDMVVCNHVLEHIEHDRRAFSEILRVLKPNGVFQFTVPNPIQREVTIDFGFPDEKQHLHWRVYGIDLIERFLREVSDAAIISTIGVDPSTGVQDYVFFASRSIDRLRSIAGDRIEARLHYLDLVSAPL